jgi:hypothetical protein
MSRRWEVGEWVDGWWVGDESIIILIIRYNISTEDYFGWNPQDFGGEMIDAKFNGKNNSPVTNDPVGINYLY